MKSLFTALFRRKPATVRNIRPPKPLGFELLEDRLTPSNLWVSTSSSTQEVAREYSAAGSLLQTLVIPVSGPTDEDARDLTVAADGTVQLYNGTFAPVLSTFTPATSAWTSRTFAGWSTVNNLTYGGTARSGNYVFVTDMSTGSGAETLKGIVRFNLADGTAVRFADTVEPIDLATGRDGRLYALDAYGGVTVYHPTTLGLEKSLTLPFSINSVAQDYRSIAANGAGELFVATLGKQVNKFTAAGAFQTALTLNGSAGGTAIGSLSDIDLAADGTLAVGSTSGVVALSTDAFAAPTYLLAGINTAFVAFREDPPAPPAPLPALAVSDVTVTEGNSGTTSATFTVTLSQAGTQTITVNYATGSGTAYGGSDFTSAAGTLTFAPGETSKTVTVAVTGDATYEPDETFTLNLSGQTNAAIADAQGVGTIVNDDAAPPALAINDVSVTEGNSGTTNATFTVTLSFASATPVTVGYYTASGTATSGTDFTSTSGTLTFAPGETTKAIAVPVIGDTVGEANETFTVTLWNATNATIADNLGQGTIVNDDAPPPTLAVNDVSVTEGNSGTTNANFTVSLSSASTTTVTVTYYTSTGTATSGTDYTYVSGTLTFLPGETAKTVPVPVIGDTLFEANETFYLYLSSATGAAIADNSGLGTIVNDDAAPTLAINDVSVTEGNSGFTYATFTVSLSAATASTVIVSYATAAGTATAGTDFVTTSSSLIFSPGQVSKTFTVAIYGDTVGEPNETFFVNLSAPTNATIADSQGVGTIVNDDPLVPAIAVNDISAAEGYAGAATVYFTVSLSAASTSTVTVNYATAAGTATAGTDFATASGTVTFLPGETSKSVGVTIYGDTTLEPDETFYLNLSAPTNATIADSQGIGTILNDDTAAPAITINDVTLNEGSTGTTPATFTVTLSAASAATVTVNYTTTAGTATAGSDFVATSGTLTFAPGQTSKTVTVNVLGDTGYENSEYFSLDLSAPVNATIADGRGVGTILNDDPAPALLVNDVSVVEGNTGFTYVTFTVTMTATSTQTVTASYTLADGTATVYSDYPSQSGNLVFVPGQTVSNVTIPLYTDTTYEPNETFYINLANPVNAIIGDGQGVCTIINDDPVPPTVSISDPTVTEGNSGTTPATFVVALSFASTQTVSIGYTTIAGSATAGTDFTATSGTLTFAPGETTKTVAVSVLGDTTVENSEYFYLYLSNLVNATTTDYYGFATITNDDFPSPNLTISSPTVTEGDSGTTPATFTLTLSAASAQPVTLSYATTAGSAAAGADFVATSGTVTFAPGETTKTVTVSVLGDLIDEQNESFTLTLSNLVNVGTVTGTGTATITDDDTAAISINDVSVVEGNSGTTTAVFTATLSTPSSGTVSTSVAVVAGTATAGTDYTTSGSVLISFAPGETSKTYTVTVIGDTAPEADETFFLNLSNPSGAVIADAQGVGTILDDEPPVINVADVTTLEGDTGTTPAVFTLTLSKPSTLPVSLTYRVHGVTAFDDIDLAIETGTVTFAPGETSKTVTVALYGDTLTEANETYQLILSGPTNATLARLWANGTIQNDDTTPTLSVDDTFMSEGNSGTSSMVFTVSLTPGATGPVTVDYSTADLPNNAVAGVDYIATSGTLTFLPGETTKSVTVQVIGDDLEEFTEQVYLNLSNPVGAPVADAQGMGYIANDDTARFTVDDLTVVEGNAGTTYAAVTVRLTNPSVRDLYVNYATSGSNAMLIPGVDYTPTSGTLTIPAGSTAATVLVAVAGDLLDESNETFFLNLTGGTNASILDAQGAVTIADDDTTVYSVSDATVTETDTGGQWVTVTVTGSNPNANPSTLNYSVVGGTATAGADFASASGTLTFAIGETVKTVSVYVYGDTADEPDETVLVNISGAFYGVIGDGQGVLTILDNDLPPMAPVAEAGPPTLTVSEGEIVTFNGSASSDPNGDPLTYAWNFGTGATASGAITTYRFPDQGTYTVTLTVTDPTGLSGTDTITVTVVNEAPSAAIAGLGTAVRGEPTEFVLSALDMGITDQAANFTYTIAWGDGTTDTVVGPGANVSVRHAFAALGSYTLSVTATDKDGATGAATTKTVNVIPVAVEGYNLVIGGTTGDDAIVVTQVSGGATVTLNGENLGTFSFGGPAAGGSSPVGGVVVYAQAGNDTVTLIGQGFGNSAPEFTRAALIFGGDGNDVIDATASTYVSILVGGAGDDDLRGGTGRDILIGGLGADSLAGGSGEDILIGGTTDFDTNFQALAYVAAEWARTDVSLATRVQHLKGELTGGYNGSYFLSPATVHDDASADRMYGGAGADWLFLSIPADADNDIAGDDLVTAL